jgi:hypothetical protein
MCSSLFSSGRRCSSSRRLFGGLPAVDVATSFTPARHLWVACKITHVRDSSRLLLRMLWGDSFEIFTILRDQA